MNTSGRIRIVSDGTANGTRVLDANGDPLRLGMTGITRIEFKPITPDSFVTATLFIENVILDIDANAEMDGECA